jgi:hypothetical protein
MACARRMVPAGRRRYIRRARRALALFMGSWYRHARMGDCSEPRSRRRGLGSFARFAGFSILRLRRGAVPLTPRLDRAFQLKYCFQRRKFLGAGPHEQLRRGLSLATGAIPWTGFGSLWQARAAGLSGPTARSNKAKATSGIRAKSWQCGGLPARSDGGGSVLGRLALSPRPLDIGVGPSKTWTSYATQQQMNSLPSSSVGIARSIPAGAILLPQRSAPM